MVDDIMIRQRLEKYRREGMEHVDGWFDDYAAEALSVLLGNQLDVGVHGDVAEIGVHHGKSFLLFANGARDGERVVALDVFEDQDKNVDNSGLGDRGRFEENIRRWAPDVDVTIVQSSSLEVQPEEATDVLGKTRAFSIDGGHTAAITMHDLRLGEASVVEDGIVILDDILNSHWTGVVTGLSRYLGDSGRLQPFAVIGNKLCLAPSAEVGRSYRTVLRDSVPDILGRADVEFFGFDVDVYGADSPRGRQREADQARANEMVRQKLLAARRARKAAEARVRALESSTSWRLTAPLRKVTSLVRR